MRPQRCTGSVQGGSASAHNCDPASFPLPTSQDRLNKLARLTKLPPAAAARAARQLPRLLALDPKHARQRVDALASLLRVGHAEAAALAGQQPGLLLQAPETLKWVAEVGAAAPGVPRLLQCGVRRACCPRSALSAALHTLARWRGRMLPSYSRGRHARPRPAPPYPPHPLRLRLSGVGALLQVAPPDARALAARDPGLLALRLAELRDRLDALAQRLQVQGGGGLGRVPAGACAVSALPPVERGPDAAAPAKGRSMTACRGPPYPPLAAPRPQLPPTRAHAAAARAPALLTQLPRGALDRRLADLSGALRLPSTDAAAAAAARAPGVLLQPPELLQVRPGPDKRAPCSRRGECAAQVPLQRRCASARRRGTPNQPPPRRRYPQWRSLLAFVLYCTPHHNTPTTPHHATPHHTTPHSPTAPRGVRPRCPTWRASWS